MSNIISVTFKGLTCDNLKNILKERETRVGDCGKKLGHPRVHIHTHRCDTEQAVYTLYIISI